jgi:hypothetical protein
MSRECLSHNSVLARTLLMNDSFVNRIPPLIKNFGFGMFCLGATLALGVVLSSQSIGNAIVRIKMQDAPIQVKGVAEIEVVSDRATWRGTVRARAKTLSQAFEILETGTNKLRAMLVAHEFKADEINACEVDTTIVFAKNSKAENTNVIESYVLSQGTTVRTMNVVSVRDLAFRATDLIKEGVEIDSGAPAYYVSILDSIKMTLLEKATQNGYERASLLARGSKSEVGGLISASQGVFQIVPVGSTDISDYGVSDTSTINKTVKAVVTLAYQIEQ